MTSTATEQLLRQRLPLCSRPGSRCKVSRRPRGLKGRQGIGRRSSPADFSFIRRIPRPAAICRSPVMLPRRRMAVSRPFLSSSMGSCCCRNAQVAFAVNDQTIPLPSAESGGARVGKCATCTEKFARLWKLVREGSRLTVKGADGNTDTFSLRGTVQLMPAEPCGPD